MSDDFAKYIEPVVAALGLTLNKRMSRKGDQRYGSNGSLSIDPEKGRWYDHEQKVGGGVLDIIAHVGGVPKDECSDWMREKGILDEQPRAKSKTETRTPERLVEDAIYPYYDENGGELFQVVRYVFEDANGAPVIDPKTGKRKKTFRQRRRPQDGDDPAKIKDCWFWSVKGARLVPYRLQELEEAVADDRLVFLVEGERKVDALLEMGVPATCFAMGAGKWQQEYAQFFRGARVILMADNDDVGRKFMADVAAGLEKEALAVQLLDLPGLPEKGDVIEWIGTGGTSQALYKLVEDAARPFEPAPFVSKFGAVVWGGAATRKAKYEELIKGLIPRRETVLIYGPSQSGKSFWAYDVSMAVARGGEYCGRKVRRGIVIYCAAEAGIGFCDRRMPAYAVGHSISLDDPLPFVCFTTKFDLFGDERQVVDLIAEIRHWAMHFKGMFPELELEVVVIDTLNKVTPGMDEISGKDVGLVLSRIDRIRAELNTGLWLVHHKNGANTGPRGHTSIYAGFETAIEIGRTGEKCFVDGYYGQIDRRRQIVQKQREGEDSVEHFFALPWVKTGVDEEGVDVGSCIVKWLSGSEDQSSKAERRRKQEQAAEKMTEARMTVQRRALYKALKKAIEDHGIEPPLSLSLPKSIKRVVDVKYWRQVWKSRAEASGPDAVRKALERCNDWLQNEGYIGRNDPWVWDTGKGTKASAQYDQQAPAAAAGESEADWTEAWPE